MEWIKTLVLSTIATCCAAGFFFCQHATAAWPSQARGKRLPSENISGTFTLQRGHIIFVIGNKNFILSSGRQEGAKRESGEKTIFTLQCLNANTNHEAAKKVKTGSKMISLYCDDLDFGALDNEEI